MTPNYPASRHAGNYFLHDTHRVIGTGIPGRDKTTIAGELFEVNAAQRD
jgi:hypothetical protein